jgi:hypothetical protein
MLILLELMVQQVGLRNQIAVFEEFVTLSSFNIIEDNLKINILFPFLFE